MSAENVLDIKLCQSKRTEKCFGHIYVGKKCFRHKIMSK